MRDSKLLLKRAIIQSNATNCWYLNINNGNTNNNNKSNNYYMFPFSECTERYEPYFIAERECFRNKKSKWSACKSHYHLAEMWDLIKEIESGEYKPKRSLCFIVSYPTYREIFASEYLGRVVHHIIAPYITKVSEAVHNENGDVTHGNRIGHSALTAVMQIQERMRANPDGVVFKFDISGFFMSISRKLAYDTFCKFEREHIPDGVTQKERLFMLSLIKIIAFNDPTDNCIRKSDISEWENIPSTKTLFKKDGRGLPIGNFPSQLLAVLLLAIVDAVLHITHFVDDFAGIVMSPGEANNVLAEARELLKSIGLTMHPKKIYIQPARHGVKFCGYVVFPDRVYIANRTRNAAIDTIRYWLGRRATIKNAYRLQQCFNSYTGMMSHARTFKIQKELERMVLDSEYAEFLKFAHKTNQIVCRIRREYTYRDIYNRDMGYIKQLQKWEQ